MATVRPELALLRMAIKWRHEWRHDYWGLSAIFLCAVAFFLPPYLLTHGHPPPVGTYIAIMGFLAAAVTFREHPTALEKAAWIFLIALLMKAEIKNLYAAEAEERNRFETTINTVTGGDTFCYLGFTPSPMSINGKPGPNTNIFLTITKVGKYPLRDVTITLDNPAQYLRRMKELTKRDNPQNFTALRDEFHQKMLQARQASRRTYSEQNLAVANRSLDAITITADDGDTQRFQVLIESFNSQPRLEDVVLRRVGGQWKKAILLHNGENGKSDFTQIDPDFPRKNGSLDVDWGRPVNGKASWDH